MSDGLYFWRERSSSDSGPEELLEAILPDKHVEHLETISLDRIKEEIISHFPNATDQGDQIDWEGAGSYFQVRFNHHTADTVNCLIFDCAYKLLESPETTNRIIELGYALGCSLYDPQIGNRYTR